MFKKFKEAFGTKSKTEVAELGPSASGDGFVASPSKLSKRAFGLHFFPFPRF
jgi:hypothetical protein